MLYSLIRNALFKLDPETAHHLTLKSLKQFAKLPLFPGYQSNENHKPNNIMGIDFPNIVGLAAGLDKNAEYIDALSKLGFGFIEVGTVTPRPQTGNPKPRMFRIPEQEAIINRLGFNNTGVDQLIANIKKARYKGILGINIGKNKDTPIENAVNDYLYCLRQVYQYANYITVNISSPNTPGLRNLQQGDALHDLLNPLMKERSRLADQYNKKLPLLVKIAPDLDSQELDNIAKVLIQLNIDGIIISNTTLSRTDVEHLATAKEAGGLSGKPLMSLSTKILKEMHLRLQGEIPLIGVGGILSASDAQEKLDAGAALVQIYTGFIYKGPALIKDISRITQQRNEF